MIRAARSRGGIPAVLAPAMAMFEEKSPYSGLSEGSTEKETGASLSLAQASASNVSIDVISMITV